MAPPDIAKRGRTRDISNTHMHCDVTCARGYTLPSTQHYTKAEATYITNKTNKLLINIGDHSTKYNVDCKAVKHCWTPGLSATARPALIIVRILTNGPEVAHEARTVITPLSDAPLQSLQVPGMFVTRAAAGHHQAPRADASESAKGAV